MKQSQRTGFKKRQSPGGLGRCRLLLLGACLPLFSAPALAGEQLNQDELLDLIYDKTSDCRKEKDQSTCVNYFSPEGEIAQLRESGVRKDGHWFLDDSGRLCILWHGKYKPLCFVVTENEDGTYNMNRKGKHKSTILDTADGNRDQL